MKVIRVLPALALALVASQAHASQYGWCEVTGHNYETYMSGIVEVEEGSDAFLAFRDGPWGQQFRNYVAANLDDRAYNTDCHTKNSLRDVREWWALMISANANKKFIKTDWLGDRHAAVDGGEKSTRPREGLHIVAPGQNIATEAAPGNSKAATANRAKDEAEFARRHAEWEASVEANRKAIEENKRLEAERIAKLAEMRAKAESEKAAWERRVAACKGGDHSQCGAPGSAQ